MYHFRNPMWESAIERLATTRALGDQLIALRKRELSMQTNVDQTFKNLQAHKANSFEECRPGPEEKVSARGLTVLARGKHPKMAGQLCAAVWRGQIGVAAAEKLYTETNKNEIWAGRQEGQALMVKTNWNIQMGLKPKELRKIKMTGQEGELFTGYKNGVESFLSITTQCEVSIAKVLEQDLRTWENERDHALSAPTSLLEQCQSIARTLEKQKAQLAALTKERQQMRSELDKNFTVSDSQRSELQSLEPYTCSDH